MEDAGKVIVTVVLSGWLAGYFDRPRMEVRTSMRIDEALTDIREQVMARATRPIPQGGMHILVNGVHAQILTGDPGYALRDGDEISFVPVVAGG